MPATGHRTTFVLRGSRSLAGLLLVSHAGAVLCLLWADPHPVPAALGVIVLALSLRAGWRRHVSLRARRAPLAVHRLCDGRYAVDTRDGGIFVGAPTPATVVHRWLVVLDLRSAPGRRTAVPIARDMLSADDHRRLRVALRTGAPVRR